MGIPAPMTPTIDTFIAREGLSAEVNPADSNPNLMTDMPGSTHWRVTILKGERSLTVPFSQGSALTDEPQLANVLDCLASDATNVANARTVDEWASDMGFFPIDSVAEYRSILDTWKTIKKQSAALRKLLGREAYERLLWETERQ